MKRTQKEVSDLFNEVAEHAKNLLAAGIKEGPGDPMWEVIKKGRTEFGHSALTMPLWFRSEEEITAFLTHNTPPSNGGGEFRVMFFDRPNLAEFLDSMVEGELPDSSKEHVLGMLDDVLEYADFSLAVPLLLNVALPWESDEGKTCPQMWLPDAVIWLDSEEDAIPTPGVDHEFVRGYFRSYGKPRLMVLDSRHPFCAGENVNAWVDVCRELGIQTILSAEAEDGFPLNAANKERVIPFGFGKRARGFG